ncbi:MAG: hypothetical protein COB77_01185 [Gammaproteobacteria bacterium]|nr:MAG: hypothetical protein COB77_01185 [Gammaproteobacteria bacterium]
MSIIKAMRQYRIVSIRIPPYHFNPGVISTFVTVALLYLMLSLGYWQLDRAEFKDTLQQNITERKNLSVSRLEDLPQSSKDRRYLPVKFIGEFDDRHSFLLDNKIVKRHVGYHVFTPVKVSDSKAVLIARGFIKAGKTREQLPAFNTPVGVQALSGLLDMPPSRALLLAENVQQTERWPVVLQYVDLSEISQLLGYELYDMILWLDENKPASLQYDLPTLNLNAANNNGYAFQWFAMSLALAIIYLVVNTKRNP